ncbi:uncharacterized protein [Choristoneura fumiferana]|uniref:uncharacterized protein n=1 Tax=Choristoneura fumiferana TaxID=7141 RepID=UPI003D158688
MEQDDDMIVIIVGDESDNEESSHFPPIKIKEEILDETESTMDTQNQEDTVTVFIKEETMDQAEEYLEAEFNEIISNYEVKKEDEDYVPTENEDDKRRYKLLHPCQRRSFVKELREQYPELSEDKDLLVCTLAAIMRNVKPPPLPQDYYVMNGIMLECVVCTAFSETIPAAGRHYQEKHGPRYLICFACGADFRSTTNLYKHEKRCSGTDVEVVLRARAIFVGNKGRQRPFLNMAKKMRPLHSLTANPPKNHKFCCDSCPAEFNSRAALVSHLYLHSGLRPFRCAHCPCAYTSQSALTRHLKQHSDVKYVCDHCDRPFKVKTALVSHLDTHLPYRKHVCEECGRRFAQKSALMLHIDGKHRNLPPPCACQLCPKRFRRMTLLKDHMRKDHGMLLMTRKMFFKKLPTMTNTQIQHAKAILKTDEAFSDSQHIFPQYQNIPDVNEEFLSYIEENCLFDQSESLVT